VRVRSHALAAAAALLACFPRAASAASPAQPAADRGAVMYRDGDYRGARDAFREAVRLDPGHVTAWDGLGWAEFRMGNDQEARRIWKNVLRLEPERAETLEALAGLEASRRAGASESRREADRLARETIARGDERYRAGDHAGAEQAYRAALAMLPSDPHVLMKLGWARRKRGRTEEAIGLWRLVAARDHAPPQVWRFLVDAHVEMGRLEEARAYHRRAVEATPVDDASGHLALAEFALDLGDPDEAERSLAAAIATPRPRADVALRAADLFVRAGRPDRGVAFLAGLPESLPGRTRALARLYALQGTAAHHAGHPDEAIRRLTRATALDPANRSALRDLGWVLRKAGRLDDALDTWKRYAAAFPGEADPHDQLAQIHLERQAYAEALAESRLSLAIDPARKGAMIRQVRSLFGLSRNAEALRVAAEAAARHPDDGQAQHVLAEALTKSGDPAAAARQWRRVIRLSPESPVARQNWVRSLYDAGQADEAIAEARLIAATPDAPPSILELLAEDAAVQQRLDEAAGWYRRLAERYPDRPGYWHSLNVVLGRLDRHEEQVAACRRALERTPGRLHLQIALATALLDDQRPEESLELGRRLLHDHPDSRAAHQLVLQALVATHRFDEALAMLPAVPASFLPDFEAWMLEARLRFETGEADGAKVMLRAAAERPEHEFIPILLYHGVVSHERTRQISARRFEEQMKALASHGYQAVLLSELARMVDGELPFPRRPILITFDDARADTARHADPILARYALKATMFVPTGPVSDEDAYHAGWETLAQLEGSGRWEMQSHGHEAHGPVPIDGDGRKGEFLVYRAWRAGDARRETTAEYLERIEREYRSARSALQDRFPGRPILAFAYPLNQVGQADAGDIPAGRPVNEAIASAYFRFGMIQDRSGYNHLPPGRDHPFMLRRFDVPGDWDGRQLLAHLAWNEPRRAARVELVRFAIEEGRPGAAERMLEEIVREEPLVAPESERLLADIDWAANRPREAAAHLAATPGPSPEASVRADSVENRLRWKNDPAAGADFEASTDSDGRTVASLGGSVRYPFRAPVDIELRAGELWISGRAPEPIALAGPQAQASISAAIGDHLDVSAWGRFRDLSDVPGSINGGGTARIRAEQHAFRLGFAYLDVDTVLAQLEGIQQRVLTAGYQLDAVRWRAEAGVARSTYDDGNWRNDARAGVLHLLGPEGRWGVGATFDYESSAFASPAYYAPLDLVQVQARATFQQRWRDSTTLAVDLRLGPAHDASHPLRPSGRARVRLSRWWGPSGSLGTSIGVEASAVPGYAYLAGSFRFEGRF